MELVFLTNESLNAEDEKLPKRCADGTLSTICSHEDLRSDYYVSTKNPISSMGWSKKPKYRPKDEFKATYGGSTMQSASKQKLCNPDILSDLERAFSRLELYIERRDSDREYALRLETISTRHSVRLHYIRIAYWVFYVAWVITAAVIIKLSDNTPSEQRAEPNSASQIARGTTSTVCNVMFYWSTLGCFPLWLASFLIVCHRLGRLHGKRRTRWTEHWNPTRQKAWRDKMLKGWSAVLLDIFTFALLCVSVIYVCFLSKCAFCVPDKNKRLVAPPHLLLHIL